MEKDMNIKARFLIRCFLLNYAIMLVWFALIYFCPTTFNDQMGHFFGFTPHESQLLNVFALTFMKILNAMFFFIPWIAIKLEQKQEFNNSLVKAVLGGKAAHKKK